MYTQPPSLSARLCALTLCQKRVARRTSSSRREAFEAQEREEQRVDAALLSISARRRRTVSSISHEPSYSHQFER